jgi:hypothetical protein
MKVVLIFCLFALSLKLAAQSDTIRSNDPRYISNIVFGQLDPTIYQGKLLNRAMSDFQVTDQQVRGNYRQTHDALSFLMMYSDVAYSYIDSTKLMNNIDLASYIYQSFEVTVLETEELEQPFGLLLHNLFTIDSTHFFDNSFTNVNNQLVPQIPQQNLYKSVLIKSAAVLEFESDNGYNQGKLIYNENFISTSDDIKIQSIKINTGEGFKLFGPKNREFEYSRYSDSIIGFCAVKYKIGKNSFHDTIQFYLTGKVGSYNSNASNLNKDSENDFEGAEYENKWDYKETWQDPSSNLKFRVAIKYGCGNGELIRRPIIFVPPYRPSIQMVSMNKYYDQFSFKSLFEHLTSLGYDVIFIKEKSGNCSIEKAGLAVANFVKQINTIKKQNYPAQDWENVLVGFSAGGQHARFALMHLEKLHMDNAEPHHHTRLYIPFDSPHNGAHVSMSAQSVFSNFKATNIFAALTNMSLIDEASKDMLMNHIIGSSIAIDDTEYKITPGPTSERTNLVYRFENQFIHQCTNTNDLRKSFPTFTRNIAISTGNNNQDYSDEFSLTPNLLMFKQNIVTPIFGGFAYKQREFYASSYTNHSTAFYIKDIKMYLGLIPVIHHRRYITSYLPEWDMAQGGYKDEFFDGTGNIIPFGWGNYNILPIGAVPILRTSTFGIGTQIYKKHLNFMPLVSALGINPTIWANNNLFYNLKDEGLMYQKFDFETDEFSDYYGYPHLAHSNDHFTITPFEAVYADGHTYDHIKMQKSVDDNDNSGMSDDDLVQLRDFIVEEVEANIVCLQNKVIGKNHLLSDPSYKYKAWYKAEREIRIGAQVTPKTDIGDFIIEKTGEVTVYAQNVVTMLPGFHTHNGSYFHALISGDGCQRPGMIKKPDEIEQIASRNLVVEAIEEEISLEQESLVEQVQIFPNPNQGEFSVYLPERYANADFEIIDVFGNSISRLKQTAQTTKFKLDLKTGLYFLKINENQQLETLKFTIL